MPFEGAPAREPLSFFADYRGVVEWIWVLILASPVLVPLVWAVFKGRHGRWGPRHDDSTEAGAMIQVMKDLMDMRGRNR